MTTAKVILCQNQGGLGYLGLLFPPGIFKRPNVCKLGGTNVNTNFHLGEDGLSLSVTGFEKQDGECLLHRRPQLDCSLDRPQDNELC